MKKLLFSCLFLLAGFAFFGQSASLTVYFDSNVSALSKAQRQRIDSFIAALPNIPQAFMAEVSGHTDNHGSMELNLPLSKNRANAVAGYLKSKRFKTADSTLRYYAYSRPAAENTESNLWKNRRVEIRVRLRRLDMPAILGINGFGPKRYKLIEDVGGTLTYDSTKIVIAPNSFTHRDGSEVAGEVEVSYQEYRTPADFILSGIPMSFLNGSEMQHFNSGGMLNIRVYQNGEELVLKKAADKRIVMDFPLTDNLANQGFFQFDTISHQWDKNNVHRMTDAQGNLLAPFNGGNFTPDRTYYRAFLDCVKGDTCEYVAGMVAKINYFLSHEEPIRLNYSYKFVKNNLVDFKSPLYKVDIDTATRSIRFISLNSHDKFGKFSNYVWSFDRKDFNKAVSNRFTTGTSLVKVVYKGKNTFLLEIDDQAVYGDGRPAGFTGSDKKLKRINKKNFKSYLKYTYDLDNKEKVLEQALRDKLNRPGENITKLYDDSLDCMNSFYRGLLYTSNDREVQGIGDFNLHRNIVAQKMKLFAQPFDCADVKRLIIRKDSIEKKIAAARDSIISAIRKGVARFGLSATGIYNADAVGAIKSPVKLLPAYENGEGRPLSVICLFITMKGLNGVMQFDGYNGYSPSKFVYGADDQCALLAIDDKGNAYGCDAEAFKSMISSRTAEGKVLLKLKSMKNLGSSQALEKTIAK